MKHECPGLRACLDHPRWHVLAQEGFTSVFGPGPDLIIRTFDTFEEALNYAQQEAARDAQKKSLDAIREEAAAAVAEIPEWHREDFARAEQLGREIMAYGYFESENLEWTTQNKPE